MTEVVSKKNLRKTIDSTETNHVIKKHNDGLLWLHSGDLGSMDTDGCIFIKGRLKRMIIRHDGFKVYPSVIENVILNDKSVTACCTVGVKDRDSSQGQRPIAFVVKGGNESDNSVKAELFELCKKELPEYAQPIDFVFIDALPLTPIGKIDYRALEKQAEELQKE